LADEQATAARRKDNAMTTINMQPDAYEQQLISPTHPLYGLIWVNPQRVSGAPCFHGTRVPIKNLWDYLEGGEPLDEFLDGFEGVSREQAVGVLHAALECLLNGLPKP
jgi:uncharacterized protein (DUF433 family)